jgi:OOP family OmpA-OmpF porin
MHHRIVLTGIAILAAVVPAQLQAQGTPSPDQIIRSLTPTNPTGPSRGIRLAPAGTSAPATQAQPRAPSVNLSVHFTTGSAELTPEAIRVLDNLGKALSDQALAGFRFRIEGHTDTVGTRDYNKDLSERRAAAVVDYLASRYQVDRSRVQAIGMGEDGLLIATPDQTPEPRNRRVQVVNIGS